jgi:hypothetical protein
MAASTLAHDEHVRQASWIGPQAQARGPFHAFKYLLFSASKKSNKSASALLSEFLSDSNFYIAQNELAQPYLLL